MAPCYTRRRPARSQPTVHAVGACWQLSRIPSRDGARSRARDGRPQSPHGGPDDLMDASALELIILPAGLIAVLFAIYLARDVLSRDTGTVEMQAVAGTIFEGAVAFIRRQYTTIAILAVVGAVVIGAVITIFETEDVADTTIFGLDLGWRTGLAFIVGAACSMASGIIGMFINVKAHLPA